MIKSLYITIVLSVILLFFGGWQKQNASGIELWHAGFVHDDEVKGKTGETWFGLFQTASGFELRETTISILDSSDGLMDSYVATGDSAFPLFLVRGTEQLHRGPIKTVFLGSLFLHPGNDVHLDKQGISFYELSARGKEKDGIIIDYEMMLFTDGTSQSLLRRERVSPSQDLVLLWAGDLDRDGKLDFLIDLSDHYNVSEPTLFLSSEAVGGELVKKAASYRRVGC